MFKRTDILTYHEYLNTFAFDHFRSTKISAKLNLPVFYSYIGERPVLSKSSSNNTPLAAVRQFLNTQTKQLFDMISALNQVATTVGHSLDLDVVFDTALKTVLDVVGAEAAGISLIDEESGDVVLRAQEGWIHDFVVGNPMRIPAGKGMSGEVITQNRVIVHNNLTGDIQFAEPSFSKEAFRAIAMAPMHARGEIIGILSIMSHTPDRFDDDIVMMLNAISDIVGVAIDNARLHEKHVENERRLQAILHSTADGIIATDKHSRISLVNHAAAQMLHVTADKLIGVPLREAAIEARIRDKLLRAVSTPADDAFRVLVEPGQELSVLVSSVQTPGQVDHETAQDGWVIVLQDITHLRQAEIARTQFIQDAAHDMKNPLSVAQSAIQTLTSLIDTPDATVQEVLGYARTGINRLQRLIDDLAQIEKIESGYGFHRDDVDIREMCHEVSAQIMPLMRDKRLQYTLIIDADVPYTFSVDREWMQRALFNYLENAAKYQYEGGQVILRVCLRENHMHFEVEDNGPGIPRSALSRVFDRFYRVDEQRQVRGSGLGLAIVKSVAEAHGGAVYVDSHEGAGSTFGLAIPLEQENWLVPA